jgi:hypothetical protein
MDDPYEYGIGIQICINKVDSQWGGIVGGLKWGN